MQNEEYGSTLPNFRSNNVAPTNSPSEDSSYGSSADEPLNIQKNVVTLHGRYLILEKVGSVSHLGVRSPNRNHMLRKMSQAVLLAVGGQLLFQV